MQLKRWVQNLSLMVGGIVLALLLVEIGLRVAGISFPIFYTADPDRGWALPPNTSGWFTEEGKSFVRVNSDGLNDREHAISKSAGTVRIAVLGDSYTEAMQVPREQNFCSVLEGQLRGCDALQGRQSEVINFGVGGYGTAQELLTLREKVWKYSPDIVVLVVCWSNDINDNSPALDEFPYRPYFVYQNGKLVEDASFRDLPRYRIHSTVWQLIPWSRVVEVVKRVKDVIIQGRRRSHGVEGYPHVDGFGPTDLPDYAMVFHEPVDPAWQEAWRVTEGLIGLIRDEVTSKGGEFLVVTIDDEVQSFPDTEIRERVLKAYGIHDMFYPNNRLENFCRQNGIEFLDLGHVFEARAVARHVFLNGFASTHLGMGHWNEAGHQLAGETIAEKICEMRRGERSTTESDSTTSQSRALKTAPPR
jgi:hypothetical protein